jgi:hypothetical protein
MLIDDSEYMAAMQDIINVETSVDTIRLNFVHHSILYRLRPHTAANRRTQQHTAAHRRKLPRSAELRSEPPHSAALSRTPPHSPALRRLRPKLNQAQFQQCRTWGT